MLIHPWDRAESDEQWLAFLRAQGFGHLVASGGPDRRVPVVTPTQYVVTNDEVVLHLARPNPIWAAIEENPAVVLSVAGDWAYVPGTWKAIGEEDPAIGIPTTYYAAVQVVAEVVPLDGDAALEVLRTQLGQLDPAGELADPSVHERLLPAIRGLRLPLTDVRAKFKYGGNADDAHRAAVVERLHARSGPGDAAAAAHVRIVTD